MTRRPSDAALACAVDALSFLARDGARIERFLLATGLSPDDIRSVAAQPAFLVGVLDHLLADEPLLLIYCEEAGVPSEDVWAARRTLGRLSEDQG